MEVQLRAIFKCLWRHSIYPNSPFHSFPPNNIFHSSHETFEHMLLGFKFALSPFQDFRLSYPFNILEILTLNLFQTMAALNKFNLDNARRFSSPRETYGLEKGKSGRISSHGSLHSSEEAHTKKHLSVSTYFVDSENLSTTQNSHRKQVNNAKINSLMYKILGAKVLEKHNKKRSRIKNFN